jgi:hypothetical protein
MKALSRLRSWLAAALHRSGFERDMETEMRFHVDRYIEDLERAGVSSDEARRRAGIEFGSVTARRDECREAFGLRILDDLRSDLRHAFRTLRASPAFTAVAIV